MKTCSRCGIEQALTGFRPRSRGGFDSYCIPCRNAVNREQYARNREARQERNRARYQANKARYAETNRRYREANAEELNAKRRADRERLGAAHWKASLRRRYGITHDEYTALLESQGGGCAICGTKQPWRRSERFAVDHDHATGKPRGLLCHPCNRGIGSLRDDPTLLRKAADYIDAYR